MRCHQKTAGDLLAEIKQELQDARSGGSGVQCHAGAGRVLRMIQSWEQSGGVKADLATPEIFREDHVKQIAAQAFANLIASTACNFQRTIDVAVSELNRRIVEGGS